MSWSPFTIAVIEVVRAIPAGKVATYGCVARMAGSPRAARQVVRVLHTLSRKEGLPWHRVVNREGRIALVSHQGGDEQRRLLQREGVGIAEDGRIDLQQHLWVPQVD